MKKSKQTALAGVMAGVSIVIMLLGSVLWVFTYVAPIITGLLMIIICDFADKKTALICYAAVSIITVFALPDKECALTYIFFFGYYPIIRDSLNKIKPKALSYLTKLIIFNAGIVSSQALLVYLFMVPIEKIFGKLTVLILLLLANLIFVVYEALLSMLIIIYQKKKKRRS